MQPEEAFKAQQELSTSLREEDHTGMEFILSFEVGSSKLGVNFDKVHEVVDYFLPTEYPIDVNGHVGVINLRGNVVPIIDPFKFDHKEIDIDQYKYAILETPNLNLVGLIVSNARKVEIESDKIDSITDNEVIAIEDSPLRYLTIEAILKDYEETVDEIE